MASVNKAIILGNLGKDPDVRYTQNGDAVATLNIATTEKWKDKNGDKQERTEWHRVVFFGRLAEVAGEYLKKGNPVYVEGQLTTRKYTDKDGVERYVTEVRGSSMQLLGGGERREGQQQRQQAGDGQQRPPQKRQEQQQNDFDDDIPF